MHNGNGLPGAIYQRKSSRTQELAHDLPLIRRSPRRDRTRDGTGSSSASSKEA